MNKNIAVLILEPMKHARLAVIDNTFEELKRIVNGNIDMLNPFENDNVCLICNRDGKLTGEEYNRAIKDDKGKVLDIISGTFILSGATEDGDLISLTERQLTEYRKKFYLPEKFIKSTEGILAVPAVPSVINKLDTLKNQGKDITHTKEPQTPKRDKPPEL